MLTRKCSAASFLTFSPDWKALVNYFDLESRLKTSQRQEKSSEKQTLEETRGGAKLRTFPTLSHTPKVSICAKIDLHNHIPFTDAIMFSIYKKQQQHSCKLECISTFAPSKSFMLFYIYESLQTCLHVSVWCVNTILQAHNLCDIFDSISFGSGFAFTGRTVSTNVTPSLFTAFLNRVFYSAFVLDDDNTFASVSVQTVWKRLVTCHHLKREI